MAANPPIPEQVTIRARLPEWLWRGRAIDAAQARLAAPDAVRQARERALRSLDLAERAREPSEPFAPGPDLARARELYREAARWALVALAGGAGEDHAFFQLWQAAGADLALGAAGDKARSERFRTLLAPAAPTGCDEVPDDERSTVEASSGESSSTGVSAAERPGHAAELAELGTCARALVAAATADEVALRRLRRQRRVRMALALVLLAFGFFRAGLWLRDASIDLRQDLAQGKPWRASSRAMRCDPVERRCGDYLGMSIFFHTKEERSPWFELDLEQEQRISEVRVRNRTDCCSALAVPLVVELSQDRRTWREVARRERNFRNWSAKFAPTDARWVRLRVDRRSMLHLERVSVYR